jgi:hypothetical protein
MHLRKLTIIAFLAATAAAHFVVPNDDQDMSGVVVNGIPYSTRVNYMRLVLRSVATSLVTLLKVSRRTKPSSSKAVLVLSPRMEPSS